MLFSELIKDFEGIEIKNNIGLHCTSAYSQVVLKINETNLQFSKKDLMEKLFNKGIAVWHANFELINSLSFYKNNEWKKWILKGDIEKAAYNYSKSFNNSNKVFTSLGIGLGKMNFMSVGNVRYLFNELRKILGSK